jgi:hypothetical protein
MNCLGGRGNANLAPGKPRSPSSHLRRVNRKPINSQSSSAERESSIRPSTSEFTDNRTSSGDRLRCVATLALAVPCPWPCQTSLQVGAPPARHPARPYTALGMRRPPWIAAWSSLGGPCPVTSLPMVTQWSRRLFLRPKISRYLPAQGCRAGERQVIRDADKHSSCAVR